MWILLLVLMTLAAGTVLLFQWIRFCTDRPPVCPPASVHHSVATICDRPSIVCVGDSITHGRVSADYVGLLRQRFRAKGYRFINAGLNGDMAYNVLQRLDDIIRCHPALVTVLVGSNDAYAALNPRNADEACKQNGLPEFPTIDTFRRDLSALCLKLREATAAPLALLSLPPFGEDPQHEAYRQTQAYSGTIKAVARQAGVAYLPVNEQMDALLQPHARAPKLDFDHVTDARYLGVKIRRFVLGRSLVAISRRHGFRLLTDGIHLNPSGAAVVADAIETFIHTVEKNDSLRLPRYCTLYHEGRLDDPRAHAP
ncbi:MAG: SGNH/GDSL hydrolase family protein [Desulfobacterales bacterium]|nr:SGNH/GDSL hydrolase family protein [Desulfobacterales bacterium]MDJ0853945.1 SGNH/GDSL hydrolase family protein [Desulfobacterales bacterium]MDJ0887628.1 SGNH/GDSL hydrolase family protein [Desulfobacterales bacterium]MDJ0991132.1 SGNH/GDSL hydrolase family protein [Desulfobacterales bacterium]